MAAGPDAQDAELGVAVVAATAGAEPGGSRRGVLGNEATGQVAGAAVAVGAVAVVGLQGLFQSNLLRLSLAPLIMPGVGQERPGPGPRRLTHALDQVLNVLGQHGPAQGVIPRQLAPDLRPQAQAVGGVHLHLRQPLECALDPLILIALAGRQQRQQRQRAVPAVIPMPGPRRILLQRGRRRRRWFGPVAQILVVLIPQILLGLFDGLAHGLVGEFGRRIRHLRSQRRRGQPQTQDHRNQLQPSRVPTHRKLLNAMPPPDPGRGIGALHCLYTSVTATVDVL